MGYPNLDNYKDELKPYVVDALEERKKLEIKLIKDVRIIYINEFLPIIRQIKKNNFEFEGVDKKLVKLLENAKHGLYERLLFLIRHTLRRSLSIALSVSARLKVDTLLYEQKKALGEMKIIGEAEQKKRTPTKDKNVIVEKVQLDVSNKSVEIEKHLEEKKRIYKEKEFKISSRIWGHAEDSVKIIHDLIADGVGLDCKELALMLDKYVKNGNSKPIREYPNMMKRLKGRFPPDLSFAAMRLARNELAELFFITSIKDYMQNPYVQAVQWLLANNRLKMYADKCDCNDIAYEDVYGLGRGVYPLDKVPDRPHVMCMCTLAPVSNRKLKKHLQGGMKLGNVPTEEWFESQNHEDNVNMIKDTEKETGLKLFHNALGKALGNASIDIIKEQEWFKNGVKEEDKTAFLFDLHKVNGRYLYILAKHTQNMQVDFYDDSKKTSYYNFKKNKVFCNLMRDAKRPDNKALGFNLGMKSFLHEAGHWLDSNRFNTEHGLSAKMDLLAPYVAKDVLNYINKVGYDTFKGDYKPLEMINEQTITSLPLKIKKRIINILIEKQGIYSNISDLFGAITYNIIHGGVGHDLKYWCYDDIKNHYYQVTKEAIAEMFESFGNVERIKAMQEFLPNAWNYFNIKLEEVF